MDNLTKYSKCIDQVSNDLFLRYKSKLLECKNEVIANKPKQHWIDFCDLAIETNMPPDKKSRWLGFLQGVLVSSEVIDVGTERNFSRPLFHEVYNEFGLSTKTVSL